MRRPWTALRKPPSARASGQASLTVIVMQAGRVSTKGPAYTTPNYRTQTLSSVYLTRAATRRWAVPDVPTVMFAMARISIATPYRYSQEVSETHDFFSLCLSPSTWAWNSIDIW